MKKIIFVLGIIFGASSALANSFPQTFDHVFGTTTVEKKPVRIVSLSYGRSDTLWALGVKPVGVRFWYGEDKYGAWPWAKETFNSLGADYTPVVFPRGDLDFEKIASLKPDLILGLWAGIKEEDYNMLSSIAPTLVRPAQYPAYGTPWDVQTEIVGRAVGEAEKARKEINRIQAKIIKYASDNPQFKGKSVAVAYYWKDKPGAYVSSDIRVQLMENLGFITPQRLLEDAKNVSFLSYSPEDFSPLDTDVLLWVVSKDADVENVKSLKMRKTMRVYQEGREIAVDALLTGAFSHANILSLDYALDTIVPLLQNAVDGNPATVVESSQRMGLID